jgi:hypothetical protein
MVLCMVKWWVMLLRLTGSPSVRKCLLHSTFKCRVVGIRGRVCILLSHELIMDLHAYKFHVSGFESCAQKYSKQESAFAHKRMNTAVL